MPMMPTFRCWDIDFPKDEQNPTEIDAFDAEAAAEAYVQQIDDGDQGDEWTIRVKDEAGKIVNVLVTAEVVTEYCGEIQEEKTDEG